jgi:hypothetical protein
MMLSGGTDLAIAIYSWDKVRKRIRRRNQGLHPYVPGVLSIPRQMLVRLMTG